MQINTIEYQKRDMSERRLWRVVNGNGRMNQIVALDTSGFSAQALSELLHYCVVGRKNADFLHAKITFSDHAGEEWTVIRGEKTQQLFRGGREISKDQFESSLLAAMLDLDAALNPDDKATSIIQSKIVYWNDQSEMSSRPNMEHVSRANDLKRYVQSKIHETLAECEEVISSLKPDRKKVVLSLANRIRPLYFSWSELNKQKKEIDLDSGEEILKPEQIENFEKEIQLLKQIEKVSLSLVDPKDSPMVINKKLKAIESKLSELSREIEMGHTSLKLSAAIQWSKVLECLTRVEAYRGLVNASEKVLHDNEELVMPSVREHVSAIDDLVIKNTGIVSELESCLASLTLYQKKCEEIENRKTTRKFSNVMRNFVNAAPLNADNRDPIGIDQARLAVDHALCKLGEIKTEVEVSLAVMSGSSDALHTRHERLVDKFGKLKTYWGELASKYRLPVDLKISEALRLMTSHGKMHDLLQLREKYRRTIQERQEKLLEIRDLIENWRYLIGSQKDISLNNENILLAEAHALLQLRPKKERQFDRYKRDADRFKAMSFLMQRLTERQMVIVEKWERAFDNAGIKSHPIQDGNWMRVFERLDCVRALESLISDKDNSSKGEAILDEGELDYPINIFEIDAGDQHQRVEFMNALLKCRVDNCMILACDGEEFVTMLHRLGTAKYEEVVNSKAREQRPQVESPKPAARKVASMALEQDLAKMISPKSQRTIPDPHKVDEIMKIFQR